MTRLLLARAGSLLRASGPCIAFALTCVLTGSATAQITGEWPFEELEAALPPRIVAGNLQNDPLFALGYLNVAHYGAVADDGLDDTQAIQSAMDEGYLYDYVVYFPAGTYIVSDTLNGMQQSWFVADQNRWIPARRKAHVLVGEKNQAVVLKLADNSPGFNSPSAPKALVQMWAQGRLDGPTPPGDGIADQSGGVHFNQHVRGIDFDLRSGGNAGAVAIRFWGAQGGSLEDIHIDAGGAFAGFFDLPGTGGGVYNVSVDGGRYGIYVQNKKGYATLAGITLTNQLSAAIYDAEFKPMTLVGFHIAKDSGPAILIGDKSGGNGHGPVMVDGIIELQQGGTAIDNTHGSMITVSDVYVRNATHVVRSANHPAVAGSPDRWTFVEEYAVTHQDTSERDSTHLVDGQLFGNEIVSKIDNASAPPPAAQIIARHVWDAASFPSFEDADVALAREHGVAGDGVTDDTAALQALIDARQKIFLPRGIYLITDTLRLKSDTQLLGVHQTFARIRPDSPTWQPPADTSVLITEDDPEGTASLSRLGIDLPTGDPSDVVFNAIHWRVGRASMVRNIFLNPRDYSYVQASNEFRNYKITAGGGGRWYGIYAENNLKRHSLHPDFRDVLVDGTSEPLRFYALDSERGQSEPQSEVRNSTQVAVFGLKSEGNQTPLQVNDSSNVLVFGYGGNATPLAGRSIFELNDADDVYISNIGPFLTSPSTVPYGQPMGDQLIGVNVDPALSYSLRERVGAQDIAIPRLQMVSLYRRGSPSLARLLRPRGGNLDPIAGISVSPTGGRSPLTVEFDAASSIDQDGVIVSYLWDFGDGAGDTGIDATHVYSQPGSFLATLTVSDDLGASASTSVPIDVSPGPVELIIDNQDPNTSRSGFWRSMWFSGSWNNEATMIRGTGFFRWLPELQLSATYDVYAWWGYSNLNTTTALYTVRHAGGSTSAQFNQRDSSLAQQWNYLGRFQFAPSASQYVELTVSGSAYSQADAVRFVPVSANQPPEALAAADLVTGDAPLAVSFDGSGSIDPDGTIASYLWDFGDGTGVASGSQVAHTFAPGEYTVVLTVTDDAGESDTASVLIVASDPPDPPTEVNDPPVAGFVVSPSGGEAPLGVGVDASSSLDSDGGIVSYAWDFGDGGSGSGRIASHTYTSSGTFTITLTVTDDRGDSDSDSRTLEVSAPNIVPVASFTSDVEQGERPLPVDFDASASTDDDGYIAEYQWNFGDGASGSGMTVSHTYTTTGTFTVTLTVTDEDGGVDSATKLIQVTQPPSTAVEFVIDNRDPNTTSSGPWTSYSNWKNWGVDSVVNRWTGYFRWLPEFAQAGSYDVYAWWSYASTNSSAAPFLVRHAAGSTTVVVDQRNAALGGRWNFLGRFDFSPSASHYVELSVGGGRTCQADAVRFVPAQ